jgi:hypothetical protein
MANPKIEVEVVAKVDGLNSGVAAATNGLDKLGKAAQKTTPQVEKLTKATNRYNSVGLDFARIVQDAPFGIIGVGNNITQLAQSFSGLGKVGDTVGTKLKIAFGQIFSSSNALILGVSILTTAFTILSQKGFFKSEEAAKSLDETLREYEETLSGVAAATLKGAQDSQKEISSLKLLQVQAENTNISLDKRIDAVNELRKLAPEYLKNLSDEEILAGNVGDAYKELTKDIIALSKAKAFSAQVDKNSANILTLLLQEEERGVKILEKRQQLGLLIAQKARGEQGGQFISNQDVALADQISDKNKEINDLVAETVTSSQERVRLNQQNLKLESQIVQFNSQGANFVKDTGDEIEKNGKKLVRTFEDLSALNIDMILDRASLERLDEFSKQAEATFSSIRSGAADTRGIYTQNIDAIKQKNLEFEESLQAIGLTSSQVFRAIANGASEGFDSLADFVMKLAETQQVFNEAINIIEEGIENTIGDVAFAIGESLGEGGNVLKAAGSALLGGLAVVLNQLGQLAIATGIAIAGIKESLKTLNPAVAIGAGIALIALAGFVSSKARSLGNSRGGGGGSGVGGGSAAQGTSFTGGGSGIFNVDRNISGEFIVRGTDLVYVLGQANNKINKG